MIDRQIGKQAVGHYSATEKEGKGNPALCNIGRP